MQTKQSVAHNWVYKVEPQFKYQHTQGNLYYQGDTIYSYGRQFPIATHYTTATGGDFILFTTRTYSNTTAKHIHEVKAAIPSTIPVIYCAYPLTSGWEHASNIKDYKQKADYISKQIALSRPNTQKMSRLESDLFFVTDNAQKYCKAFDLPVIEFAQLDSAKIAELKLSHKIQLAEQRQAQEAREALALIEKKEAIDEWLANTRNYAPSNCPMMLRVKGDIVQSSRGTSVSVKEAIRVLPSMLKMIRIASSGGVSYDLRHGDHKVGDFLLLSIDCNHTTIGCHVIPNTELLKIAQQLGVK